MYIRPSRCIKNKHTSNKFEDSLLNPLFVCHSHGVGDSQNGDSEHTHTNAQVKKKNSQKNCLYFMQCTNSFYSITTFLFYIKPSQDHILLDSKYPMLTYSLEKNTALCVTVIHSGLPARRNIYLRLYYVPF